MSAFQISNLVPRIDEGSGVKVVFLHGAPENRNEWRDVIDLLHTEYHCIAPDLLGFGDSSEPPADYDFSLNAQVQFFDDWVKAVVGDEPFILVTHDIGAIMGIAWASQHPQQVIGLIVMNTVLHADYEWHTLARIWSTPLLGNLFMLTLNRFAYRIAFQNDFPQVSREHIDSMYDGLTKTARKSILHHFRQMTQPTFFEGWEENLAAVVDNIPTTVLWGVDDPLIPEAYAPRIGGTLKKISGCGHWVPLEKPERVAEEVRLLDTIYQESLVPQL